MKRGSQEFLLKKITFVGILLMYFMKRETDYSLKDQELTSLT